MIRIKAVDAQNILEVCGLASNRDGACAAIEVCSGCNAVSIAEAKYDSEMRPNAIYNNNAPIGFFMYKRAENQAEKATILRFMIDDRFRRKGYEEKALEHILRGLKIQGVRKVEVIIDNANENEKNLYPSFGFRIVRKIDKTKYCYELEL